jgi:hypothetical protein
MKTLKNTKMYLFVLAVSFFGALLMGCSEHSSIMGPTSTGSKQVGDVPPAGDITVNVVEEYGGYIFQISNMTNDTINDFHVQFDTSVTIYNWSLTWMFDPVTTDLNHGKIGEKARPNDQPVLPGQQNRPLLWVKLSFRGENKVQTFNWQATKNGVTIKSGSGKLP